MPLVSISLIKGKPRAYVRAIGDGIHRALMSAYGVPADDRFQIIHEHEPDALVYDSGYLGIDRTDDIVIVAITAGNWRETGTKQALFRAIAQNLAANPGLRPQDIVVTLVPNGRDDWSFGNGLASYVDGGTAG